MPFSRFAKSATDRAILGPLANARRLTAMSKVMDNALSSGAKIATGGERVGKQGNFFAPTVLIDVPLEASVFND